MYNFALLRVTVAAGETDSEPVLLGSTGALAVKTPDVWATPGTITFKAALRETDTPCALIGEDGNSVTIPSAAAGKQYTKALPGVLYMVLSVPQQAADAVFEIVVAEDA